MIVRDRCVELRISLPEGLGLVRLSNPAIVAHTHKKSRQNGIAGEWWEIPFSFFLGKAEKSKVVRGTGRRRVVVVESGRAHRGGVTANPPNWISCDWLDDNSFFFLILRFFFLWAFPPAVGMMPQLLACCRINE